MEHEHLKLYSKIQAAPVDWLWYPFIPYGKITLLQGDPGDGKSTLMMNIIANLSTAGFTPDGKKIDIPRHVIYQCSEDDASDTIKPRMERYGADCTQIAFIDESSVPLTLDDERIREAIHSFRASLLVIDPVQAYLGETTSLSNANQVRKMMQRLGFWATSYNCAIVLIGHLNKKEGTKDLYRSFGSIDVVAAARSVLQINPVEGNLTSRYIRQVKNSLAPIGPDFGFSIDAKGDFHWLGELQESGEFEWIEREPSKKEKICAMLISLLEKGSVRATEAESFFINAGISMRTVNKMKRELGVKSVRKGGMWFWSVD